MLHELPILLDAGLVLLGIFVLGFIALRTNFPNVILYILFGISLGKLVSNNHVLDFAGEVAIVLLFFLLGLEFSTKRLASIAKKIWTSGMLDVVLSLGVTVLIGAGFGLDWYTAFLIGGMVYATSSSITVKLLVDKERMANKETEFVLGVLIFEDLVAPIIVAILMALHSGNSFTSLDFIWLALKIILLAGGAILLGKTIFKHFGYFLDKIADEDIKVGLLVGLAVAFGGLSMYLGLSEVLGAFLAGVMLAEAGKEESIQSTVNPVKDLLLPVFFIHFGTTISLGQGIPMIGMLVAMVVWSIVAKVLVGAVGGKWYGLSSRVAFRAGLSLCARGEFSVVIAALAASSFKVFGGIYIVLTAAVGMLLFNFAPKITRTFFGEPQKNTKSTKMPY